MSYDMMNNNKVFLQGKVADEPIFNHTVMDEHFYTFNLEIPRLSGQMDLIPVTISSKLIDSHGIKVGEMIALRGQFRSFNKLEDGRSRLILSAFCREICELDSDINSNCIELSGYICKSPIYRTTPFSREICDLLIAVNRNYDKSDYIPCIAWGRNAQFVNKLPVGTKLEIVGRIQSRTYNKRVDEKHEPITKTAYEVSITKLALAEDKTAL